MNSIDPDEFTMPDWTDKSPKHFRFNMAQNFVTRIESKLDELGWSHSEFATTLGVTKGRISRVFNNPGNLTLDTMIRWCRALDLKPAIVVYEDSAVPNRDAPIHPAVFIKCWEALECPTDMWAF
jgi:transcriptional regulator with XRE-family HTH domain